jgi:uncharacterized protein (DUF1778 family)
MMANSSSMSQSELEQRIAIVRDDIRQLIEQAAAISGAQDEDRNADRSEAARCAA